MKFVKCFTQVRFLKFSILPAKLLTKIENSGCFIYLFWTICKSFCKFLQLFCEKSSLFSANFTEKGNLSNSKTGYYYALLAVISLCELLANYIKKTQCQVWSGQKCDVLQLALSFDKLCHNATAHQKGLIKKLASALPADYKCIFCIMVIITDRKSTDKDVPFMGPWAANQLYLWNMFICSIKSEQFKM